MKYVLTDGARTIAEGSTPEEVKRRIWGANGRWKQEGDVEVTRAYYAWGVITYRVFAVDES